MVQSSMEDDRMKSYIRVLAPIAMLLLGPDPTAAQESRAELIRQDQAEKQGAVHAKFGVRLLDFRQRDSAVVPGRCAVAPEEPAVRLDARELNNSELMRSGRQV
jgi:hypothetical protein